MLCLIYFFLFCFCVITIRTVCSGYSVPTFYVTYYFCYLFKWGENVLTEGMANVGNNQALVNLRF